MSKNQINKTVYIKPEIEVMQVLMENGLLLTGSGEKSETFPGQHNKGEHKTGPTEESNDAKEGYFEQNAINSL
ncbi:hypothetical protein [Prevotella falsenii]|uniref:hypothetical protein n=1 Tax=Prevotella falsenii TaxID=515414 RepID=UPI00046A022B|nr:hypothetical protein [Prevotella falsenii]